MSLRHRMRTARLRSRRRANSLRASYPRSSFRANTRSPPSCRAPPPAKFSATSCAPSCSVHREIEAPSPLLSLHSGKRIPDPQLRDASRTAREPVANTPFAVSSNLKPWQDKLSGRALLYCRIGSMLCGRITRQSQRPQTRGLFLHATPVRHILGHSLLALSETLFLLLERRFGSILVQILGLVSIISQRRLLLAADCVRNRLRSADRGR